MKNPEKKNRNTEPKLALSVVSTSHPWFVTALLVFAVLALDGCGDDNAEGSQMQPANAGAGGEVAGSSGGGGASGSASAGSSGSASAGSSGGGGASDEGGAGDGDGTISCWTLQPWAPEGCGSCQLSLDEFCQDYPCSMGELAACDELPAAYSVYEGCGLVRVTMEGHGGAIYAESVYDAETGALSYYYDNGGRSAGCMPELTVGEAPDCTDWTTRCQGEGGA